MNKRILREARRIRNRAAKDARKAERRPSEFEALRKNFKVEMVDDARFAEIAKTFPPTPCFECGKKILKKDFRARGFIAVRASRSGTEYLLHNHFFEADQKTELPGAKKEITRIYNKIFRLEFSDYAEFLEAENV